MGLESWYLELAPLASMVMLQCLEIGLTTLSKAAMSKGMSRFVLVVYSNALATLILLPYAIIVERKKRPPLNVSILCKFFLLSLAGVTLMQNCAFTGIDYSSPTLASAINNLVPAFTFLLGVILRMEKLDLKSSRGLVKIVGTLVLISGAMIIVFYKGSPIGHMSDSSSSTENTHPSNTSSTTNYWIVGGVFIAIAALSKAVSIIGQAAVIKEYPSQVTVVAFYCLFGTIQSAAFSLFVESDPNAWRMTPDVELISVFYTAIIGNALTLSVQMWCIQKKGPLFVAMFAPLGIAIAALMGAIFLGDTLYVGSVIGAVVIVVGFYGVMWAQWNSTEMSEENHEVNRMQSTLQKTPLLESYVLV